MVRESTAAPTAAQRGAIAAAFRAIAPLADVDLDAVLEQAHVLALRRGVHVLRGGELATRAFVVLDGVLREYWLLGDGSERTKGFSVEGELIGSLSDLNSRRPSRTSIDALTPARVAVFDFAELVALAREQPAWVRFFQAMVLRLYLAKSEREWELLALDAAGRYARFRERFVGIEARIPQRVVASYLGITPVHLSRLRSRSVQQARRAAGARRGSRRARA